MFPTNLTLLSQTREEKVRFLSIMISMVVRDTREVVDVDPSHIGMDDHFSLSKTIAVAGEEPEKTARFLLLFAKVARSVSLPANRYNAEISALDELQGLVSRLESQFDFVHDKRSQTSREINHILQKSL